MLFLPRIFLSSQRGSWCSSWQQWAQNRASGPHCSAFFSGPGPGLPAVHLSPSSQKEVGFEVRQCGHSGLHQQLMPGMFPQEMVEEIKGFSRKQTGYSSSLCFTLLPPALALLGFLSQYTLVCLHGTINTHRNLCTRHTCRNAQMDTKNLREKSIGDERRQIWG